MWVRMAVSPDAWRPVLLPSPADGEVPPVDEAGRMQDLIWRAAAGDREALDGILGQYREPLHRMIRMRLDRRLQGRVDASDVVQEAWLEISQRLDEYARDPKLPFLVWIRFLTAQKLAQIHRHHLGVQGRNAARERPLAGPARPGVTSFALAEGLAASQTSPSEAAARQEMRERLRSVLETMEPLDREILSLRHFEQLSNAEAAQELGLAESAASKRYMRAFRRLRELMGGETAP